MRPCGFVSPGNPPNPPQSAWHRPEGITPKLQHLRNSPGRNPLRGPAGSFPPGESLRSFAMGARQRSREAAGFHRFPFWNAKSAFRQGKLSALRFLPLETIERGSSLQTTRRNQKPFHQVVFRASRSASVWAYQRSAPASLAHGGSPPGPPDHGIALHSAVAPLPADARRNRGKQFSATSE